MTHDSITDFLCRMLPLIIGLFFMIVVAIMNDNKFITIALDAGIAILLVWWEDHRIRE